MSNNEKNISGLVYQPKIDKDLIKRIKEIQVLPEEVIYKFIKSAGSLSKTGFAKRFKNAN